MTESLPFFTRGAWNDNWGSPGNLVSMEESVPLYKYLSTPFEQAYEGAAVTTWSRQQYWLSPFFCVVYAIMITLGPRLMKNRPAFDLKEPLKYWNLFLAVFSFLGAMHCVPHLFLCLAKFGFRYTVVAPAAQMYMNGPVGFWTMCFIYSKYFELIDTAFIILRKKPMMFLHWYHHLTVLLYTWDAYCQEMPTGQYFIAMNYTVHAIMYFYYYLAACSKPPKWALLITVMQITQMIIGFGVTLASIYYSFTLTAASFFPATLDADDVANAHTKFGHTISLTNAYFGLVIYGSYFYLFCQFFVKRYILGAKPGKAKSSKKADAPAVEEKTEAPAVAAAPAAQEAEILTTVTRVVETDKKQMTQRKHVDSAHHQAARVVA
eukprot:GDKI01011115.1.p1 GENE.GDKI01011115.1~~GDKI01011115.1.p1  ORF type:complete len:377 (+),score=129.21 GDKI01011115.1:84-1214(+)